MHVHVLGICGTFMGGLAQLAAARGDRVTGADSGVYPPRAAGGRRDRSGRGLGSRAAVAGARSGRRRERAEPR